jgi:hypothetical protein
MTVLHALQRFRNILCHACHVTNRVHPVCDLDGYYRHYCYECALDRFAHLEQYYCCDHCGEFNHEREGFHVFESFMICEYCIDRLSANQFITIDWTKEGF